MSLRRPLKRFQLNGKCPEHDLQTVLSRLSSEWHLVEILRSGVVDLSSMNSGVAGSPCSPRRWCRSGQNRKFTST